MTEYEVIKATTPREALELSRWRVGDRARCREVKAIANSDGTFTVIPVFAPVVVFKRDQLDRLREEIIQKHFDYPMFARRE